MPDVPWLIAEGVEFGYAPMPDIPMKDCSPIVGVRLLKHERFKNVMLKSQSQLP